MGAVDLVIQVEIARRASPAGCSASAGPGTRSASRRRGVIFPKYRGDLLECAVVTARMHEGAIEETRLPRNPLDVLAQQIVAMTVREPWTADELFETVRRAAPYESLTRDAFEAVLGMLAGAYPSRRIRGAQGARRVGPRDGPSWRGGATRGRWRSRAAARSRTAGSIRCSWSARPGRPGGAWASWTRRWSTRAASAR